LQAQVTEHKSTSSGNRGIGTLSLLPPSFTSIAASVRVWGYGLLLYFITSAIVTGFGRFGHCFQVIRQGGSIPVEVQVIIISRVFELLMFCQQLVWSKTIQMQFVWLNIFDEFLRFIHENWKLIIVAQMEIRCLQPSSESPKVLTQFKIPHIKTLL
jgi:hypothetical protein